MFRLDLWDRKSTFVRLNRIIYVRHKIKIWDGIKWRRHLGFYFHVMMKIFLYVTTQIFGVLEPLAIFRRGIGSGKTWPHAAPMKNYSDAQYYNRNSICEYMRDEREKYFGKSGLYCTKRTCSSTFFAIFLLYSLAICINFLRCVNEK